MTSSPRSAVARLAGVGLIAAASLFALSGCGAAPFLDAEAATPTPTAVTPAPIVSITNDLATGSTVRQLSAGSIGLTATYWSELGMDKWTAVEGAKPLKLSVTAQLSGDEGQQVYLSSVSAVLAVSGPLGSLPGPPALTDTASIPLGYAVKAPYSYSQTFVLPAVDPTATSVTISVNYELLLQTTPTSSAYAKQTATDVVTIALAP
jgi:hypothetical protein